MQNPFLIGQTVYLRPLEKADAPLVATWFNDPEVRHFLRRCHPTTAAAEEAGLGRLNANDLEVGLGVVVREGNLCIGFAGLHRTNLPCRNTSFGITLGDKSAWGKGYGTETARLLVDHAFGTLNLNRVWLHVHEYNIRGVRAYEKAGFRVEARMRQEVFRLGRYWDTIVMAVLRAEWEARRIAETSSPPRPDPSK